VTGSHVELHDKDGTSSSFILELGEQLWQTCQLVTHSRHCGAELENKGSTEKEPMLAAF